MIWSLGSLATRVFYRLTLTGEPVPPKGPVLLVANHPNALLDPALVVTAARRPVRFLAKAPLFDNKAVGWLARATGAVPVYRRMDDPESTGRNSEMFRAVFEALRQGAAVGLFPEGVSHSSPSMERLRTGAARIALGAFEGERTPFPIIPIGLVHRHKARFRSSALVILGTPVAWDDLRDRDVEDRDAVRELTDRIETALRQVTINLEHWEDRPVVECAEAIWAAEHGGDQGPVAGVGRVQAAARVLGQLRRGDDASDMELIRQVEAHDTRLRRLGLRPHDLARDVGLGAGVRWAVRRVHLLGLPVVLIAVVGKILFRVPYWLTDRLATIGKPGPDQLSTHRVLAGIPVYVLWVFLLAWLGVWLRGFAVGAALLVLVPAIGFAGLWIRERWADAWSDIRSFFLMRSRQPLIESLQKRQADLARRLRQAYEANIEDSVSR